MAPRCPVGRSPCGSPGRSPCGRAVLLLWAEAPEPRAAETEDEDLLAVQPSVLGAEQARASLAEDAVQLDPKLAEGASRWKESILEASRWSPLAGVWPLMVAFLVVQFGCWFSTGDSFFGYITGGVVESFRLDTAAWAKAHVVGGATMWILAAFQVLGKRFRQGGLAWVHRASGRALLSLWFGLVGPSAFYLSVHVGIGKGHSQAIMTLFTWVSLDTMYYASYFYWRGLLIVRHKVNGAASIKLHRTCMELGTFFTMVILVQRPLQLIVIVFRTVLLLLFGSVPWLQAVIASVLDHNIVLSLTTACYGWALLLCVDGPRSGVVRWLLTDEEAYELFGSPSPGRFELCFWRFRPVVYLLLRGMATRGWTVDPCDLSDAR